MLLKILHVSWQQKNRNFAESKLGSPTFWSRTEDFCSRPRAISGRTHWWYGAPWAIRRYHKSWVPTCRICEWVYIYIIIYNYIYIHTYLRLTYTYNNHTYIFIHIVIYYNYVKISIPRDMLATSCNILQISAKDRDCGRHPCAIEKSSCCFGAEFRHRFYDPVWSLLNRLQCNQVSPQISSTDVYGWLCVRGKTAIRQ